MPITSRPECSVITVNHRSVAVLERMIRSLSCLSDCSCGLEIIVANNDPSEEDSLRELGGKYGCDIVSLTENRGFAEAANRAAERASGNILCFLNPDAELLNGSFEMVERFFEAHPEVGIVGARLVGSDGRTEPWSAGSSMSLRRLILGNLFPGHFISWLRNQRKAISVGWVSGGALCIRKDLFRSLNGFDEGFFLYFEDMDLCVRAKALGYRTIFHPGISFRHKGGSSFASFVEKKRAFYRSQERFFRKYRPAWEAAFVRLFRPDIRSV